MGGVSKEPLTRGSASGNHQRPFHGLRIAESPTSAAAAGAQYIITGQRGTRIGEPSDAITVQFGTDGGTFTASNNALKIAA